MTNNPFPIDELNARINEQKNEVHFYPGITISGGRIEQDWQRHREESACKGGCPICDIRPFCN